MSKGGLITVLLFSLLIYARDVTSPLTQEQGIGKLLVYNGNIEIYSRGFKTTITEGMLPLILYPGDEIKTNTSSNCQILLSNNNVLNLAPETHLSVDWFNNTTLKFFLKYGSFMIKTDESIYLKTTGTFIKASAGHYVAKYNRVKLQATLFSIKGDMLIKHENSNKVFKIKDASYISLFSYSNNISNGHINTEGAKRLTRLFYINYKPDGRIVQNKKVPGKDLKGAKVPFTDAINLDYAKRQSGI